MDIEKWNGYKETREYGNIRDMMKDAEKEARNPETKKLTLHFPKMIIPSRKSIRNLLKQRKEKTK